MTKNRPPVQERAPAEPVHQLPDPTGFAELEISLGPTPRARGRVPPDQAHHFITTFGLLGSAASGIGGAVLTLHIAASLSGLALAELGLALLVALLIAVCGHTQARRASGPKKHSRSSKDSA
ncbi:MAG TPA: hypothetical protein VGI74_22480 [Streptosporangiaceae bacterium]|jgi:hypothetical protein